MHHKPTKCVQFIVCQLYPNQVKNTKQIKSMQMVYKEIHTKMKTALRMWFCVQYLHFLNIPTKENICNLF